MDYKSQQKEVFFDKYCEDCSHYNKPESEFPCSECLKNGYNWDSHKPKMFVDNGKNKG